MKRSFKNIIWIVARLFFSLFPLDKNKAFFKAYNGLRYTCNPKAISEKLHEIAPEIKIVWSFNHPEKEKGVPSYVISVKKNSLKEYYHLFTAKFWVMNAGSMIPQKRKGQLFMDTWHGDRAFKHVAVSTDGSSALAEAYKNVDVLLSGSDYGDRVIREAMKYKGEILKCGSPRNDLFFNDTKKLALEIKEKLGLNNKAKTLMFAPTFRGQGDGVEPLHFSKLLDNLEKRDNEPWQCLIRQHYKVPLQKNWTDDTRIVDVSAYSDMQELLLISDVVISDYSSLVGDFALLSRSILLYVPDIEEYKAGKGLYFDLEKSPYQMATTETELFEKILSFTLDRASKNCQDILIFYGNVVENGFASENAVKWMLERKDG
ncbi:MAG: hypothetical protein GX638_12215 [Crenarchaeota archaeon]|nr:hypothetical protein [Thermoproteota archaeon]